MCFLVRRASGNPTPFKFISVDALLPGTIFFRGRVPLFVIKRLD